MSESTNNISLSQLTDAAGALLRAEQATEAAEAALKQAKEHERLLREETLPGIMRELGAEKFTIVVDDTSYEISVKQEVYASVPEARKDAAYGWLEVNGYGGLIKTGVTLEFGRDELEKAQELVDELAELGYTNVLIDRNVNPQTLKAFLRERLAEPKTEFTAEELEQGMSPLSLELFGARPVDTAKVKVKKK